MFHRYDEELALADVQEKESKAAGVGVVKGRMQAKKLPTWK